MIRETPHRLVLWDVDLTLVDGARLGRAWYATALRRLTGLELRHPPTFAGRTERAVTLEVFAAHGLDTGNGLVEAFFAELVAVAAEGAELLAARGRALPGAAAALTALAALPGVTQSVVTGNLRAIARQKLSVFGLDRHIDFAIGGYGDASLDRADLVAAATARASAGRAVPYGGEAVVVLGDTPADVEGALRNGAVAVGVATGLCAAEDLRAAGAHAVLPDLRDTDAVLDAVLGRST
ncbi:Phosphoglycolate phosphatase, HAD superfamily [Streptoalloteichus tenebrarius]|uniref:Phosphoglycolate phosphatase, HAD superfamily n=1 Tax=Streptoalloteichus tenebrarius (strain ATCC 17920 / DSM 40477 / JCM 4838 / CBS 697.72 / NBRC 16177 / NCIMB 11028 / NRRL B-12390 / A12253. 1 / ISP 5477) TaxID=1933 RepID=A0ABT1HN03_STRSD|nr:haloacid dehalogenase-like hydrolase [Streptoalloteichus tenebrarius]MCP2256883.1 Phosphoglycolate phosphatase, HAD superfamily [Streptoalloteichus tenebrarius]BFF00210.1 haloacid dehalogenase-like hydrolase [Streptoalloteichus tenebrarius]